jgi:hypothetical protein
MSRFWKSILCFFYTCCFYSFANAEDLDPASHAYLLDMKYAKHIEVKVYLVTKDQVIRVFSEENVEVTQKTNKELFDKEIFLLVRCKNKGDYRSFGTLNCSISNQGAPTTIEIAMMPGYMKSFHDSVLYIGRGTIPNDNKTTVVSCKWKNLYTI